MHLLTTAIPRRQVLRHIGGAFTLATLATPAAFAVAQPPQTDATLRVTQLLDMSPDQQQTSRDYATGIRLAFAELRKANLLAPQLSTIETDGTAAAARVALQAVKDDPTQLALLGTSGEGLALTTLVESQRIQLEIAHVAPWLADPRMDTDPRLFALFASREDQLRYVLRNMAAVGVAEVGVVYPNPRQAETGQAGMNAIASRLQMRTRTMVIPAGQDIASFASKLPANAPFYLVFMGGSIELALFTQGLSRRGLQRYVLCLSDVDTNTFLQLNPGKSVPVVFTDVVPNPHASKVPVVRAYRAALQRLDEAPSPVGLAGYLAGRYTATVLASIGPSPTRARVLAEFQRRRPLDLDGWRLEYAPSGRASNFVSQTLLNAQGQLVG